MTGKDVSYFISKANEALKQKNLLVFSENIGIAKYIAPNEETMLDVLECQALGYFQFNLYSETIELINKILDSVKSEKKLNLLRKKGISLVKLGEYAEGLSVFRQMTLDYPNQPVWGYGNLGWAYIYLYQEEKEPAHLQKAEEYLQMAMEFCSENKDLYKTYITNLGNVEWQKGNYHQSLELFLEAADLDSENPTLLNNIAAVYVNLTKENYALFTKIEEYLEKAEGIANETRNNFELGQTYVIRARNAIELNEDFVGGKDFYLVAFDYFISSHAFPEAIQTLNRILEVDQKTNKESIEFLGGKLQALFGKGILTKEEERI